MDDVDTKPTPARSGRLLAYLPVVLLVAAWALYLVSRHDTYARALSVHGYDLDMADTFQRGGYRARLFLPFIATVMFLDILALAALIYAAGKGLAEGWRGCIITIVFVLTFLWHGLDLLWTLLFSI